MSHVEECIYGTHCADVLLEFILADELADLPIPQDWHLVVKNINFTLLLLEFILIESYCQIYPPIKHKSLEHHYTESVSYIKECKHDTHDICTTPNQAEISETALHQISFTYRRMHIYPWQMYC